ncbi:MAG: toll/interleukin-1 receptor domain-containing protein [Chitinophagales bacterium]|nr:toll/interleukin-1 receptor domain-containing protein [Chitinophagales bacterium]
MKDFFISYNHHDKAWSAWIAFTLEKAGYSTFFQDWDFRPGDNFVLKMQEATVNCAKTIAVLSNNYLASIFTQPEWATAFSLDPTGKEKKLIPIKIEACMPAGLLKSIVSCDLTGLDKNSCREKLLDAVKENVRPETEPAFPGPPDEIQRFNFDPMLSVAMSAPADAAHQLKDLLKTTSVTFLAQAQLRDELYQAMTIRLQIKERLEYEPFFMKYYSKMNKEERHLYSIVRAYTKDVLYEYNQKALELIQSNRSLIAQIPQLQDLHDHLEVWLSKFRADFESKPEMCLVYVGVHEKVPFPKGIEAELDNYIAQQ